MKQSETATTEEPVAGVPEKHDEWLDVERDEGTTLVRLTPERLREAEEHRRLSGGGLAPPVFALNILSHRMFEVTGLRYVERHPDCYATLRVVRGYFSQLLVWLGVLAEGDSDPDVSLQSPRRGVWPTRIFNPPRQNLSFWFEGHLAPVAVEVHWKHMGRPSRPGVRELEHNE